MPRYLILVTPAANRVFAGRAAGLTATEFQICSRRLAVDAVETVQVAGVDYIAFRSETTYEQIAPVLSRLSAAYAIFEQVDDRLLRPVELIDTDLFTDDLVTIPKYQGKTNEQFTRLLVNVTAAAIDRTDDRPRSLLDPLCGRGTTLSVGLTLGYEVAGVEADTAAVEAYAAFLKGYFRRKRIKHKADLTPVRREGRSLGKRLEVTVTPPTRGPALGLTVYTGDTRQSAALLGKRRFDLVVADAPYGVVHGSSKGRGRNRSPADLLGEAVGVWAGQLKAGGALGISWNTYGLSREDLTAIAERAGLEPIADEPYTRLGHRVDSSIHRDVFVARRPRS